MVSVRLADLAISLNATIQGDHNFAITGAAAIEKAGAGDVTYVADETHVAKLADCAADVVVLPRSMVDSPRLARVAGTKHLMFVDHAQSAFLKILEQLRPHRKNRLQGISPAAHIDATAVVGEGTCIAAGAQIGPDAVVGRNCVIHAQAVIGAGCQVGDDCILHPHVVLYDDVILGQRVIIHAGAVLGADGYSYKVVNGRHERIPHFGSVRVQDDVEIGANTTIDRGMIGETVIGEGTKIDNLVQIAHNCEVGPHNLLVAQVGLAGSVTTGTHVVCAGQVGVADHIHLGDRAVLGAKAAVHRNIPADETWLGHPALPVETTLKIMMASKKLPAMREQFRTMQNELNALKATLAATGDAAATGTETNASSDSPATRPRRDAA